MSFNFQHEKTRGDYFLTINPVTEISKLELKDAAKTRYQKERIAHWDRVSKSKANERRLGSYYHKMLQHYYRLLIPPGMRILELGCCHGDLLASLKPSFGVGIDFSSKMLRIAAKKHSGLLFILADANKLPMNAKFDVVILSDLVNDLWDVQGVLEKLQALTHSGTRFVLNFYNNIWRLPLSVVKQLGLGADLLEQNWFSPHDIFNLLELAGFEVINHRPFILFPIDVPFFSSLANRYLVNFPPFSWLALTNFVIARTRPNPRQISSVKDVTISVIVPARNESGNIENLLRRLPRMGKETEVIFVEGHSSDNTYETIENMIAQFPDGLSKLLRQSGRGKGDAVRLGFKEAKGDVLIILDADLTVPPEVLPRFVDALVSGRGEFINGVRLVYPLENQSMRFLNMVGNKFFSLAFSWLLGQPIKDTLCGTKVLWKSDYETIAKNRHYFGDFDPFGDFDLLFGAARLNFKIADLPVRYRSRAYGDTNIDRWRHGLLLLKMVLFAAKRIKFI
jgi:2-polyprenyl-3-methyl-5-hydroxy-6-metoxy-1,4-benzoquinol methylase